MGFNLKCAVESHYYIKLWYVVVHSNQKAIELDSNIALCVSV